MRNSLLRRGEYVVLVGLLIMVFCTMARAESGNVNALFGEKQMSSAWEPNDEQGEGGIMTDMNGWSLPFNFAFDFLVSVANDNQGVADITGVTVETCFGVRKYLEGLGSFRPYIGGGLAVIAADVKIEAMGVKREDDDQGVGFWLNGGLGFLVGEHLNLGLDFRLSRARVTLLGEDVEAGGNHVLGVVGYHW